MAKGNMLQGMARGKVGDVVFSRLNGEQISRVRNRHPKNPRTNPQLYQRAIMATCMQAYSMGKEIFDHAFQGYAVGSECQRRFMKLNAKQLRSLIANDINQNVALSSQAGRVVAPGVPSAIPALYQISEGSYDCKAISINKTEEQLVIPEANENETVAQYCTRNGFIGGDIYTVLAITKGSEILFTTPGIDEDRAKQYSVNFMYYRLSVKADVASNSNAATFSEVFDVTTSANMSAPTLTLGSADLVAVFGSSANAGVFGVIRSRLDADLRSNSFMVKCGLNTYGIATEYILDAWAASSSKLGDSDLILEGGDI